jgi:hypothetical protein
MLNPHAIQSVCQYLAQFAATDEFESTIESIFGTEIDRVQLVTIRKQWLDGDFSLIPEIRIVSNETLATANGGYVASLNEILVSADFLARHQNDRTPIANLQAPIETIASAMKGRNEGLGIRATGRVLGVAANSVINWEKQLATAISNWSPPAPTSGEVTIDGDEVYTRAISPGKCGEQD